MRRLPVAVTGVALLAAGLALSPATAATPTSGTLTVPTTPGTTRTLEYKGTVPVGSDPTSDCSSLAGALADVFTVKIAAPAGGYSTNTSKFLFTIQWEPPAVEDVADLVLEVVGPDGKSLGSSDGSNTTEAVTLHDLASGTYTVYACGFVNAVPQDYIGAIKVTTLSKSGSNGPSANAANTVNDTFTTYTPATVVDPILYGGEPAIAFDPTTADASRSFVSWPVSSRTHIGTLYRSADGGLSYLRRQADVTSATEGGPACLGRPRPYCFSGGGGDTDVVVEKGPDGKPITYMADQEFLANQAVGTSFDGGISFPADHVDPIVSKATGVDRQWLGAWSGTKDVFLAYHVPLAGEYVHHSADAGATGSWSIPPTPQIPGVTQSGAMYVDNQAASPHRKAIYLAYLADGLNAAPDGGSAFDPAATPLDGFAVAVSTDGGATFVNHKVPGGANARNFVKVFGDTAGNLYAVWTDSETQQTYLSTSPATQGKNATAPGSVWSKAVQVTNKPVNVSIFPDVVAGDPGRVAVIYYGTGANAATPDDVKPGSGGWYPYVAVSTDALCQWASSPCTSPTFHQTSVAHKINHNDNICTSGTACAATGGNRNLADFWDISIDPQGHLGFVWGDTVNGNGAPFVKVSRQASGPSLYAGKAPASLPQRANGVGDPAGDAKSPVSGGSYAGATNRATLDLRGLKASVSGSNLEFRVSLLTAKALGAGVPSGQDGVTPVQQAKYLVRWDDAKGSYYAGANVAAGSDTPTFFSGTVGPGEALLVTGGGTTAYGNTYAAQSAATGRIDGNDLVIDVPASAVGSPTVGTPVFSMGAYSLVGPPDALALVNTAPLTIDSTPTFDTRLAATATTSGPVPSTPTPTGGGSTGTGNGSGNNNGGSLAATGGSAALSVAGLALLLLAAVSSRRRRT